MGPGWPVLCDGGTKKKAGPGWIYPRDDMAFSRVVWWQGGTLIELNKNKGGGGLCMRESSAVSGEVGGWCGVEGGGGGRGMVVVKYRWRYNIFSIRGKYDASER